MRPTLKDRPFERLLRLCALVVGTAVHAQEPPQPPGAPAARPKAQCPSLVYPPAALRRSAVGVSKIEMSLDAAGNVTGTQLIRPSGTTAEHALLDEAAMKAAAACRLSIAEGAMPTKIRVDFTWRLGDSALPNDWPPANPGPLSNTSRAEVLRQLYGLVRQVEVDRCVAGQPELAASIQASFAAFADRAQKALGSLIQDHPQALAEPVPVALLEWLAQQKTPRISSVTQILDKALCPDLAQRFEYQTLTELRNNMLFDLSILEGRRGNIR